MESGELINAMHLKRLVEGTESEGRIFEKIISVGLFQITGCAPLCSVTADRVYSREATGSQMTTCEDSNHGNEGTTAPVARWLVQQDC